MSDARNYPIKIINISDKDYNKPKKRGGPKKIFCKENEIPELRKNLTNDLVEIKKYFSQSFNLWPDQPVVAKVNLKDKAIAKSHRPSTVFNDDTCPIIGDIDFGKLLISITKTGLSKLNEIILHGNTQENIANISTLENIEPYTISDKYNEDHINKIFEINNEKLSFKIKIFKHNAKFNNILENNFNQYLGDIKLKFSKLNYSSNLTLYKIYAKKKEEIFQLANFSGVQSISKFPEYKILKTHSVSVGSYVFPTEK